MAEPTSIAGLAIAACSVLGAVVAYLFREWNAERANLLKQIAELQAARVADAKAAPEHLLKLATENVAVLKDAATASEKVAEALGDVTTEVRSLKKSRNG